MEHVCAAAGFFPHPPIMLPEIGGPELSKMAATVEAVEAASALIVSQKPETLVILSPHNYVFPDGAAIIAAPRLYGNLAAFGYPELSMDVRTDMDLAEEIVNKASQQTDIYRLDAAWSDRFGHPLSVDQGTFVPLYYLRKAGFTGPIVIMAPRFDDYDSMTRLGDIVIKAATTIVPFFNFTRSPRHHYRIRNHSRQIAELCRTSIRTADNLTGPSTFYFIKQSIF